MKWWERWRSKGSVPKGMEPVTLYSNTNVQYFYQEKQSYGWPSAPAREQRSALINCWSGNQLPSTNTYIPGVHLSYNLWNIPTSYSNDLLKQIQRNKSYNIQNATSVEQSNLMKQALENWQNRVQY